MAFVENWEVAETHNTAAISDDHTTLPEMQIILQRQSYRYQSMFNISMALVVA